MITNRNLPYWIPGRAALARNDGRFGDAREVGVTLIELVVVMTILGILAAVAAVALRDPVRMYQDSNRRAQLTDMADTALRRMARDIRLALPNSLRVSDAATTNLELLLTRTGGRYREQQNDAGQGDVLDFALPDSQFDTLGAMSAVPTAIQNGDILIVYNLFSNPAITTSNAYTFGSTNCSSAPDSPTCNTTTISGTGAGALTNETQINFAARQFPHASPGNRFHVVQGPVTYECAPGAADAQGNATGTLYRISDYTIALNQPTGTFGTRALLANNVAACTITYDPLVLTQSLGLVSIALTLTRGGESVSLYHEIHVTNIP